MAGATREASALADLSDFLIFRRADQSAGWPERRFVVERSIQIGHAEMIGLCQGASAMIFQRRTSWCGDPVAR
jgi:hypothetical protein